jgi:hypothetical protein
MLRITEAVLCTSVLYCLITESRVFTSLVLCWLSLYGQPLFSNYWRYHQAVYLIIAIQWHVRMYVIFSLGISEGLLGIVTLQDTSMLSKFWGVLFWSSSRPRKVTSCSNGSLCSCLISGEVLLQDDCFIIPNAYEYSPVYPCTLNVI